MVRGVQGGPRREKALAAGDLDAIFRRYGRIILRRCGAILRDAHEAEDAAQEIMVMLASEGSQYRWEAAISTWIYRVTTNVCLNRLRTEGRRTAREGSDEVASWLRVAPATPFEQVSAKLSLEDVLARLDDLGRQVFIYTYWDGMSQEEIARVTGYSRKTIGKRLQGIEAVFASSESEGKA